MNCTISTALNRSIDTLVSNHSCTFDAADTTAVQNVTTWIWRILSPILLVIGVTGNILIILVLYRINKRRKITYVFLLILAVSDTVVLFIGLGRQWILHSFDFDVRKTSDFGCKFFVFMIYFSMHFSSWTLVCITFERFLKTRNPFRTCCANNDSRLVKLGFAICILITIGLDVPLFVTNGLVVIDNSIECNNTTPEYFIYEEKYFVFIDLVWLSCIPFILMFVFNIFVGKSIRNSFHRTKEFIPDKRNRDRHAGGNKRLTRMLFWTSLYFLMTTLPISIHFCVDSYLSPIASKKTSDNLALSKAVLYMFQFSNYAVNFFIYIKVKDSFRNNLPCKKHPHRHLGQSISRSNLETTQTDLRSSVSNGYLSNTGRYDSKENDRDFIRNNCRQSETEITDHHRQFGQSMSRSNLETTQADLNCSVLNGYPSQSGGCYSNELERDSAVAGNHTELTLSECVHSETETTYL